MEINWAPEKKLSHLPSNIRKYFIDLAQTLYHDLKENHLHITTAPAPEPKFYNHKIRVVNKENPY